MGFSNAELFTLSEVLENNRFLVPEFQRGYAWGIEQWTALWDDVMTVSKRAAGDHFGGTIMIAPAADNPGQVHLIDGQQRLTSVALLLRALGRKAPEIKFAGNLPLQIYFDYYALGAEQLAPELASNVSYYTRNLAAAAAHFSRTAESVDANVRERIADALLERFKMFVLTIRPEFDVHVAFETINNRGRQLSVLERLKNRLIYVASNASDQVEGRSAAAEVHRCWQSIYRSLGSGKQLLDDDEFLRSHSIGWFKQERKAGWLNSQLFDHEFSAHGDIDPKDVVRYVRSLELAARCWLLIHDFRSLPPRAAQQLESLHRISWTNFKPLILWALYRMVDENRKDVFEGGRNTAWATPIAELAKEAERFVVLIVLANGRQSTIGQTDISRSTFSLVNGGPLYLSLPELSRRRAPLRQ